MIAKEAFLEGAASNSGFSFTNAVFAVLDFDYASETLIKAVLLPPPALRQMEL